MNIYPKTEKHYNFDILNDDHHIENGRILRSFLEKILTSQFTSILYNDDVIKGMNNRFVDYIHMRIITLGYYYDSQYEDEASELFLDKLNELLNLSEDKIQAIHKLALVICNNYKNNTAELSKGQYNKVKGHAKRNLHACYICGRSLIYSKKKKAVPKCNKCGSSQYSKKDTFELEHIVPQVFGGSKNNINLAPVCENCNKIKDDQISYYSVYFEGFTSSSTKEENAKLLLSKEIKLSLILKQNSKCKGCNKYFYEIESLEKLYIAKIDEEDTYHYFNSEIYCSECQKNDNIKGIEIGLQL